LCNACAVFRQKTMLLQPTAFGSRESCPHLDQSWLRLVGSLENLKLGLLPNISKLDRPVCKFPKHQPERGTVFCKVCPPSDRAVSPPTLGRRWTFIFPKRFDWILGHAQQNPRRGLD